MTHYVCTGECGAKSEQPGICHSETCSSTGQALVACNCEDGLHEEVLGTGKKEAK